MEVVDDVLMNATEARRRRRLSLGRPDRIVVSSAPICPPSNQKQGEWTRSAREVLSQCHKMISRPTCPLAPGRPHPLKPASSAAQALDATILDARTQRDTLDAGAAAAPDALL
jgi:hypothetical protein